jgi:uncharacterized membrane protein YgaE (UPF0421/DUF939 family)
VTRGNWLKGLQISARAAIGAALALLFAGMLRLDYPIYAMLAAVIVTELSPAETRRLAVRRLGATAVGAVCGAFLVQFLPPSPSAIGLGILTAMLICNFAGMQEAYRVAGYICGIAMLTHGSDPWRYALFRFIETVLGIVVAGVISFVPTLLRIDAPDRTAS